MNVLLHTCCACCLLHPLERLRAEGHRVTSFYYNPNIHPASEYLARLDSARSEAADSKVELIVPAYRPVEYFRAVSGREEREEDRCPWCYRLRLYATAERAREGGYDAFTTTLLVSPYQRHVDLKAVGEEVSRDTGVPFLYGDFRLGFAGAHEESRERGHYRQKYCGCLFSEADSLKKKLNRATDRQ